MRRDGIRRCSTQGSPAPCLLAGGKMLVVRSEHVEKFRQRVYLLGFGIRP